MLSLKKMKYSQLLGIPEIDGRITSLARLFRPETMRYQYMISKTGFCYQYFKKRWRLMHPLIDSDSYPMIPIHFYDGLVWFRIELFIAALFLPVPHDFGNGDGWDVVNKRAPHLPNVKNLEWKRVEPLPF